MAKDDLDMDLKAEETYEQYCGLVKASFLLILIKREREE